MQGEGNRKSLPHKCVAHAKPKWVHWLSTAGQVPVGPAVAHVIVVNVADLPAAACAGVAIRVHSDWHLPRGCHIAEEHINQADTCSLPAIESLAGKPTPESMTVKLANSNRTVANTHCLHSKHGAASCLAPTSTSAPPLGSWMASGPPLTKTCTTGVPVATRASTSCCCTPGSSNTAEQGRERTTHQQRLRTTA